MVSPELYEAILRLYVFLLNVQESQYSGTVWESNKLQLLFMKCINAF